MRHINIVYKNTIMLYTNIIKNKSGLMNKAVKSAPDQVSSMLRNGFVNPLAFDPVNNLCTSSHTSAH